MSKDEKEIQVKQLKIIDVSTISDTFESIPIILDFLKEEEDKKTLKNAFLSVFSNKDKPDSSVDKNILLFQVVNAIHTSSTLQTIELEEKVNFFLSYLARKSYPLEEIIISYHHAFISYFMPLQELVEQKNK